MARSTQSSIAAAAGAAAPPSDDLPAIVGWLLDLAKHCRLAADRDLRILAGRRAPWVLEGNTDENTTATFFLIGRAVQAYLRTAEGSYGQWSLLLGQTGMETHFADSIEVLHNKLEELVPDGIVDINLRGASDLRLSRYFADFAPKPDAFPEVFDFSKGGPLADAPRLEDLSTISTRSLVAASFSCKLYDKDIPVSAPTGASLADDLPAPDDEPKSASPKTPSKNNGKRDDKGKGKANVETGSKTSPVRRTKTYGVRFELSGFGIWGATKMAALAVLRPRPPVSFDWLSE